MRALRRFALCPFNAQFTPPDSARLDRRVESRCGVNRALRILLVCLPVACELYEDY